MAFGKGAPAAKGAKKSSKNAEKLGKKKAKDAVKIAKKRIGMK